MNHISNNTLLKVSSNELAGLTVGLLFGVIHKAAT